MRDPQEESREGRGEGGEGDKEGDKENDSQCPVDVIRLPLLDAAICSLSLLNWRNSIIQLGHCWAITWVSLPI